MIILDFQSVQDIVFANSKLRLKLDRHKPLFDSWLLSVQVPAMRQLGKRSVIQFLDQINEEEINCIREFFKDDVVIKKLDANIISKIKSNLDELELDLNNCNNFVGFAISRKKEKVSVCLWK